MATTPEDAAFRNRIERTLETVRAWEDPELLKKCREQLPPIEASSELDYFRKLVKEFQQLMTWVNQPPCCGAVKSVETRGPVTDEEKAGQASRVEVYNCESCKQTLTFPRYNCPAKLLQTKSGRCGEYANLFGLYCRSTGIETRYVLDVTDHVWTEVYLNDTWHFLDGCEGVLDEYSMYEKGWGKKLCYNIAISTSHVMDVTPKYTRHFHDDEFQARRRQITSSEASSQAVLDAINASLQRSMSEKEAARIKQRLKYETAELELLKQQREWEKSYGLGRISGSLSWKLARSEAGDHSEKNAKVSSKSSKYHIEVFYPQSDRLVIELYPEQSIHAIRVNSVSCAVGEHLSVVILNESGCILQSRSFEDASDVRDFVASVPEGQIVCMAGSLSTTAVFTELGKFDESKLKEGVLFVGQVCYAPDWATCLSFHEAKSGIRLVHRSINPAECKLRTVRHTRPTAVVGRLPDSIMPLRTQQMATEEQKRIAFLNMKEKLFGYTTKPGAPVYLLGETAYPMLPVNNEADSWNTFLLLPKDMVPPDDIGMVETSSIPNFEVPVDTSFFERSLGTSLLTGGQSSSSTYDALRNARLVALYFSAHWCGPCRSFTPMLAEMYEVLKDAFPKHGLEIVFVSADRDPTSFSQYFASMPWLAIPFESTSMYNQILSATYEVRGIPSLVVLDSVSGQIVIPNSETRQQVSAACSRGDIAIKTMFQEWLDRVPAESKQLLEMLETSCLHDDSQAQGPLIPESYLVRPSYKEKQQRINSLISDLVDEGLSHDDATKAALDVEALQDEEPGNEAQINYPVGSTLEFGQFAFVHDPRRDQESCENLSRKVGPKVSSVLQTASKYLDNCIKEPWNPKYRTINLSFKVADHKITSVPHSLELLSALGFEIVGGLDDFSLRIPVHVDLETLSNTLKERITGQEA